MHTYLSKFLLVLLVCLGFFIFALPFFGNTAWGKEQICRFIFEKHDWKGSVEEVSFHWTSFQKFKNLTLSNGEFEVLIKEGEISITLFDIVKNPFKKLPISLTNISIETDKRSFLEEIFFFLHLSLNLEIKPLIACEKMDLILDNGVYTYEETPFIVGKKYPFLTKGKVYAKEKRVDIDVGPTAAFLKSTFKIKNLPEDFFLPFHIKGEIGKTSIESEKALELFLKHFLAKKLFGNREFWS